jgi:hypothetical protein
MRPLDAKLLKLRRKKRDLKRQLRELDRKELEWQAIANQLLAQQSKQLGVKAKPPKPVGTTEKRKHPKQRREVFELSSEQDDEPAIQQPIEDDELSSEHAEEQSSEQAEFSDFENEQPAPAPEEHIDLKNFPKDFATYLACLHRWHYGHSDKIPLMQVVQRDSFDVPLLGQCEQLLLLHKANIRLPCKMFPVLEDFRQDQISNWLTHPELQELVGCVELKPEQVADRLAEIKIATRTYKHGYQNFFVIDLEQFERLRDAIVQKWPELREVDIMEDKRDKDPKFCKKLRKIMVDCNINQVYTSRKPHYLYEIYHNKEVPLTEYLTELSEPIPPAELPNLLRLDTIPLPEDSKSESEEPQESSADSSY